MAATAYAAAGLVGTLTPQANTTVEPEFAALLPPGWSSLTARLVSDDGDMIARLGDYGRRYAETAAQFANAPLGSIAAACTGVSYLLGLAREAALVAEIEAARGVPFVTSSLAATAALRGLGATRIALLSPYPEALNGPAHAYWQAQGFEIVATAAPRAAESGSFHPIYAMRGEGVLDAHRRLGDSKADAVLMLGTGMATLRPLLAAQAEGLMPAISCNLALVWAATQGKRWDALDSSGLGDWMRGTHWAPRLSALFGDG
jgi:maleate cis-trans isomerase